MDYLKKFDHWIFIFDGWIIETGGRGDINSYIKHCMEIASQYYQECKQKEELIKIVDAYIIQYESQTAWKFYKQEMEFLFTLKQMIEQL